MIYYNSKEVEEISLQGGKEMSTSNYSEFLKGLSQKDKDFYFGAGNYTMTTNNYFTFKNVIDEDNIIIVTNNVKMIKDSYVLIVSDNKAVYLKDWQVRSCKSYKEGIEAYFVKLNRKYFKPYTFSFTFEDMCFEKEDTFDTLVKCAREQEAQSLQFHK